MSVPPFVQGILKAVITGLVGRTTVMIKAEVERAKAEFEAKLKGLGIGIGLVIAAATMLCFGIMLLFIAGLIALTEIWPAWLVALAGGGVAVLFGLIFLAAGQSKIKKNKDLKPDQAIDNIRSLFGA